MGSFLVEDFASHQSIKEGSSVMIFPLLKQMGYSSVEFENGEKVESSFHSRCYLNADWSLIGLFFECIIEDRGQFKLKETLFNKKSFLILLTKLNQALKTKAGENEYHDLSFDIFSLIEKYESLSLLIKMNKNNKKVISELSIDNIDKILWKDIHSFWEEFCTCIDEQRVFIYNYRSIPVEMNFSICLKKTYDHLTNEYKSETENRLIENLNYYFSHVENIFALGFSGFFNEFQMTSQQKCSYHLDDFCERLDDVDFFNKKHTKEDVLKMLKKNVKIVNFCIFQAALNELNIKLCPINHSGSDYQNEIGKKYARFVKKMNGIK